MSVEQELGYQDGVYARLRTPGLNRVQQAEIAIETFCDWVSLQDLNAYADAWKKGYNRESGRKETESV